MQWLLWKPMGDMTLVSKNNNLLKLNDCLYVSKSKENLILVFGLNRCDYLILF